MTTKPQRPDIARDLIGRVRSAEKHWTMAVSESAALTEAEIASIRHMDHVNAQVLKRIVAAHGWPGRSLVGEEATQGALMIALQMLLRMLSTAVRHGEATQQQWAHLYDRCRVYEQRPQLYGTQHRHGPSGLEPCPIRDPEQLNARRASVGLPPYNQRTERAARRCYVSQCDTPAARRGS